MKRSSLMPRTNAAAVLALLLSVMTVVASMSSAYAATLTSASLTLTDSRPSVASDYLLTAGGFTTTQSIGCIDIDLGTAADGTGAPANTSAATLFSQNVATGTWTIDNTASANNVMRLTNPTPATPTSGSKTIDLSNITNGAVANTTYYAKLTTYQTSACSTAVDSVTVTFMFNSGQQVTASVDPTLTFTVAGVTSGDNTIASIVPNVTTTNSTVPFGTITSGSNKIAAQDLTVVTNAGNGYTVSTLADHLKTSSHNFADTSGTNAAPATFSTGEAFGYTTSDTSLSTGDRFVGATKWARFNTTNAEEVAYNTAAVTSDKTRIGIQAGISSTTPAGAYTTTIVYTAVPIY